MFQDVLHHLQKAEEENGTVSQFSAQILDFLFKQVWSIKNKLNREKCVKYALKHWT